MSVCPSVDRSYMENISRRLLHSARHMMYKTTEALSITNCGVVAPRKDFIACCLIKEGSFLYSYLFFLLCHLLLHWRLTLERDSVYIIWDHNVNNAWTNVLNLFASNAWANVLNLFTIHSNSLLLFKMWRQTWNHFIYNRLISTTRNLYSASGTCNIGPNGIV